MSGEICPEGALRGKTADEIPRMICEPAMGSAAFLNEAINQLARRILPQAEETPVKLFLMKTL